MIEDQPPPKQNDAPAVWDLVILDVGKGFPHADPRRVEAVLADMRERDKIGRERYSTPLQAHNGRNARIDAYQEALDCVAYLRQCLEEDYDHDTRALYWQMLGVVMRLRARIEA